MQWKMLKPALAFSSIHFIKPPFLMNLLRAFDTVLSYIRVSESRDKLAFLQIALADIIN